MGIGDWGWGIGDWGLGPIPNPQSPIPNPQLYFICNNYIFNLTKFNFKNNLKIKINIYIAKIFLTLPTR